MIAIVPAFALAVWVGATVRTAVGEANPSYDYKVTGHVHETGETDYGAIAVALVESRAEFHVGTEVKLRDGDAVVLQCHDPSDAPTLLIGCRVMAVTDPDGRAVYTRAGE